VLREAGSAPVVDLLHARPRVGVDADLLRQGLRFAIESGDAGGLFERCVRDAPVADSGWDPSLFASSLFLEQLVGSGFPIVVDGRAYTPSTAHLVRLLGHPPDDRADVDTRQAVLRELAETPALRARLETLFVALRRMRELLDERPIAFGDGVRRKVELLATVKEVIDLASDGFGQAGSALRRLDTFGRQAQALDAYRRMERLLEYEGHLATVDVRIRVGSDGKIREAILLDSRENPNNPLRPTPLHRFFGRLLAWLRGYRYREQEVLLRLLDDVFAELEDVVLPCFALIGDVELYLASLGFRDRALAEGLEVSLAELHECPELEDGATGPRRLEGLFNPLLWLQEVTPIPCDLASSGHDEMVLITGPNSGGKTRVLQAIGLAQLLGQGGLFVPARRAELTRAPALFASLIEGAPADQKEGRLGTELLRVRRLFEVLEPGTLVLVDELCSGTNPSEGIAIFEMVVGLLPRLRPQVFVTTHFLDAAERLSREGAVERLAFLQVELADGAPTYRFVPGVASTSLAHQVASRLGVTHEELEALVEARLADRPPALAPRAGDADPERTAAE
jgi:DNA mismatch repair protein MutS2